MELKGESEEKKERGKSHPINKFGKQTRKDRRGEVEGEKEEGILLHVIPLPKPKTSDLSLNLNLETAKRSLELERSS